MYIARTVIPKLPHTEAEDEAVDADCTHSGLTIGSHCSVCGEVIQQQEEIPALGHSYVIVPETSPTHLHKGLTEGVQCERCGEWLIEQEEIPPLTGAILLGDVDGDDDITIIDVTYIQRKLAGLLKEAAIEDAADTDEDGDTTILDATFIQRWLAGLPSNDNIGKQMQENSDE